jgi:hypothetical protein
MTAYYVGLRKIYRDSYGSEVIADSEEEAQNKVLLMAPGSPDDWEVTETQTVRLFGTDAGAAEIL